MSKQPKAIENNRGFLIFVILIMIAAMIISSILNLSFNNVVFLTCLILAFLLQVLNNVFDKKKSKMRYVALAFLMLYYSAIILSFEIFGIQFIEGNYGWISFALLAIITFFIAELIVKSLPFKNK
jgi:asparagine N-glycosylation enzyme membrane subunit Stt3